jgi:hypothetical protein
MPRTSRSAKTPDPEAAAAPAAAGGCGHGADRCAQCTPARPAGPHTVDARVEAGRPGRAGR